MGEMLEDAAVTGEAAVEHLLAVILVAAPQDMVMGAGHDLDRVELDEAEGADERAQVERPGWPAREPLPVEPERPGGGIVDPQGRMIGCAGHVGLSCAVLS